MSQSVLEINKNDLAPEGVSRFESAQGPIAVYELDGTNYATQDGCTHARASLSEGEILDGELIECPVHGGTFHIPSGRAVGFPCKMPLRTYKVSDAGATLRIDLECEAAASRAHSETHVHGA